jgi:hypothetical protein
MDRPLRGSASERLSNFFDRRIPFAGASFDFVRWAIKFCDATWPVVIECESFPGEAGFGVRPSPARSTLASRPKIRPRIAPVVVATIFVGTALLIGASGAFMDEADAAMVTRSVVAYYANETTLQTSESENYAALLSVLRKSTNPLSARIAEDLVRDAREFPLAVAGDVQVLLAEARQHNFDLAVFTNALAQEHRYLIFKSSTGALESNALPALPVASNIILATSPLSRPDYFRTALAEISASFGPNSIDLVLITNSHGNDQMVLTPRVIANLSEFSAADVLEQIDLETSQSSHPFSVAAQGTSKIQYWQAIADASQAHGLRFPLVFRAACESGIASWAEYFAIPASVRLVAHTGMDSIASGQIDFAKLFVSRDAGLDMRTLATELESRGIHVDSNATLWLWPVRYDLSAIPLPAYFIPMVVWLTWTGRYAPLSVGRRISNLFKSLNGRAGWKPDSP